MATSIRFALVSMVLAVCWQTHLAPGQMHESFDAEKSSFRLIETDCNGPDKVWIQKRLKSEDRTVEQIQFQAGAGTKVLVAHDISPPCFVIPELSPSIAIKADRPGIQFMVRIVLPETPSADGSGPMTTLLSGGAYENSGRWQNLTFADEKSDLRERLKRHVWMLRREHGSHVSAQNAYVDQIVLNLYTNAGNHNVQIDDLRVDGVVSARSVADKVVRTNAIEAETVIHDSATIPTSFNQPADAGQQDEPVSKRPSLIRIDGTVLEVKKSPFFPRIIQHNGESFESLKLLGFNTIELRSAATTEQLQSAQKLDLWVICPPPPSIGLEPIPLYFDRVLAWTVGQELTRRDLKNVQQTIREIRHSDVREGRPVVAHASTHWTMFGTEADILSIGMEPLGTSFLASQYGEWIRQRADSISNNKPVWAKIQTEFSARLLKQVSSIAAQVPPTPIEPQQLKFLTYEALSGGARGLRFMSRNRLDADDPVTRLRALSLKWINAQISQLEPWAVGGALMGQLPLNRDDLEVTAVNTNRSRLLLIQRPTHHEQYWAGDRPLEDIQFQDATSTFTDRGYWLSEHGLVPLPTMRNLGGADIQVEQCPYATAVVLTQDPLIVNRIKQSYEPFAGQTILQMHTELTRQWLAIMQLIDGQMSRMGRGSAGASGSLNEAVNSFRKANELLTANSPTTSVSFLDRADERMAFARREFVTLPLGMFQSKTSTPFLSHSSLVPVHWELVSRLERSQWNPNSLAGGDFENLEHMTRNGWLNRRVAEDNLITKVELAESAANGGTLGLKLSVTSNRPPKLIQSTPVWVTTPKMPVKAGQLIRIHGWINVPKTIQGNHDGLMITESIGGRDLAERILVTDGWKEFTLYRGAPADGEFDLTFGLSGLGEAMIDEVTIRTIDLPRN